MSKELEQYSHDKLFDELSALIEQGKQKIAFAANSTLTLLFWQIGNRINDEILLTNVQIMADRFCRHCRKN